MIYEVRGESSGWVRVSAKDARQAFFVSIGDSSGVYVGKADGFFVYQGKNGHLYKVREAKMTRKELVEKIDALCYDLRAWDVYVDEATDAIMSLFDKYVEENK
jgi:hypothetical protein